MLDQLKDLIRDNAQQSFFNNDELKGEQKEKAVEHTVDSIKESLQEKMKSGDLKELLAKGQNYAKEHLNGDIQQKLAGKLRGLNLSPESSEKASQSVVSDVLSKIFNSGEEGSGIDFKDLIAQFTDGNFDFSEIAGNLGDKAKGAMGKMKDMF